MQYDVNPNSLAQSDKTKHCALPVYYYNRLVSVASILQKMDVCGSGSEILTQ